MRIVMLGKPGSGKGTQSLQLAKDAGVPAISTGDIIRGSIASGSELGQQFRSYTQKGLLVPDSLVLDLVRDRLLRDDCMPGFVLDGFPRTVDQAVGLDAILFDQNVAIDLAIYLEVSDQDLLERATGRRWCPADNRIYHIQFAPPAQSGICDACGGALVIRDDDKIEVVRSRLNEYAEKTAPLVDFYSKRSSFRRISGVGKIELIRQQLSNLLLSA